MRHRYLLLLVITAVVLSSPAWGDSILSIEPGASTATPGASFSVNIDLAGVTDLYAYQFDLVFDPAIVSALSITEGSFLPGGGETFFIPGTIDNTAGTLTFTADTLLSAVSGASGSGTLATVNFLAVAPGSSSITLSNVMLLDSNLIDISATTANGNATIIPEPAAALLLATGLGALWIERRRAG